MQPHLVILLPIPARRILYCSSRCLTSLSFSPWTTGTVIALCVNLIVSHLGLQSPSVVEVFRVLTGCPQVAFSAFNRLWALRSSDFVATISQRLFAQSL